MIEITVPGLARKAYHVNCLFRRAEFIPAVQHDSDRAIIVDFHLHHLLETSGGYRHPALSGKVDEVVK